MISYEGVDTIYTQWGAEIDKSINDFAQYDHNKEALEWIESKPIDHNKEALEACEAIDTMFDQKDPESQHITSVDHEARKVVAEMKAFKQFDHNKRALDDIKNL